MCVFLHDSFCFNEQFYYFKFVRIVNCINLKILVALYLTILFNLMVKEWVD